MEENKVCEYTAKEILEVLDRFSFMDAKNECLEGIKEFFDEENFSKYLGIKKREQDRLDFNIFKVLTKQWRYENLHSEALKLLLEFKKKTEEGAKEEGSQETLKNFFTFLNKRKLEVQIDIENYKNAKIECEHVITEQRRIDILITGESSKDEKQHAIIIENKVYNAKDEERQIYDYYKHIEKSYIVDCIVYLVPTSRKKPSANSLGVGTESEESIVSEIEERLIILPSFTGNEGDLVSHLEDSLKGLEDLKENEKPNAEKRNEENYRVFLYNYIDLLKDTGAGDMTELAMNFLEKIKTDEDYEKLKFIERLFKNEGLNTAENTLRKELMQDPSWLERAEYISAMLEENTLGNARAKKVLKEIKSGSVARKGWEKDYWANGEKYFTLQVWANPDDDTVIVFDDKNDKENFEKFKNSKDLRNKVWDLKRDTEIQKYFNFPSENDKLIETVKELDKILTEKNF